MAYLAWGADHNNKYPMEISVTNGGAMESVANGDVAACFGEMSNELKTPKILNCPADPIHPAAIDFTNGLNNSNISYFVCLDADESHPNELLSGDANFEISGTSIHSGLLQFSTNVPIGWDSIRHPGFGYGGVGNLGFADGGAAEESSNGLHNALLETGLATNRLAIP